MANRSDFFGAKLPRGFKRMLAMEQANGWVKDSHEYGKVKKLFIDAHASHVRHKLKRNTENRDASEATE
jgi:hypothetical protein